MKLESLIGLISITVLVISIKTCEKKIQPEDNFCRDYRSIAKKLKCEEDLRNEK